MAQVTKDTLLQMLDQLSLGVTLLELVDAESLQFRFCYANSVIEKLLQFPLGSVVGHTLLEAFPQTYIGPKNLPKALLAALDQQKRVDLHHEAYQDDKLGAIMYDAYCQALSDKFVMIGLERVADFDAILNADLELPKILLAQGEKVAKLSSWIVDPISGHTVYSQSYLAVHHFEAGAISTSNATEFSIARIHPEDAKKMQAFRERENRSYPDSISYRFLIPDGSYIWLEDTISNMLDDGRLIGTTQDVTIQQEQRIALEGSNKRLNKILETSPEIIYIYNLLERRNTFSNKSIFEELGFSSQEILDLGTDLFVKTIHPLDLAKVFAHHGETLPHLADKEVVKLVYRIFSKHTNRYAWMESTESVFERTEDGTVRSIIGIAGNISTVREAQLAEKESNEELESFIYSMSHDLRAPIRHVESYSERLLETESATISVERLELIERIILSAKRLGGMVDGLLAYSRTRNASPKYIEINTLQLIEAVREELSVSYDSKSVDWQLGQLPNIYADKKMMRQVWTNLIANALKYSSTKPRPCISIEGKEEDDKIIFSIKDNGVGFDPSYINKLFIIFQRLHTRSEFPGHGIGLANVKRAIEIHDGEIWAESVLNEGASFYFSLPTR
ncbi:MAG: ATP-binding protein [Bacteroidia bacterium]